MARSDRKDPSGSRKRRNRDDEGGLSSWKGSSSRSKKKDARIAEGVRKNSITLGALVLILILSLLVSTPLGERITQGLDLQGGVSVVMAASKPNDEPITTEEMDTATAIVTQRVNSLGASEATVQKQGDASILVQIPGATDPQQAIDTVGRTGFLEFVNLLDIQDQQAVQALMMGEEGVQLTQGTYTAFMTGDSIEGITVGPESEGSPNFSVNLRLDSEGAARFAEVSRALAPFRGQIAIVLDGVVNSAPAVQSEIPDGRVAITGRYTLQDAQTMKTVLDSGSLPVTLSFSDSRVVGPTLGQESLTQGLGAILIGFAIVSVYLLVFYRGLGLLTVGSLVVFAIMYLGVLAGLSQLGVFALSLPGIAGIVLTIGMAADSSILVLERFKEEISQGRSVRAASLTGVQHGIRTSIDADVVALVSAIALFLIPVGPVKGFGLTLALGIIVDIITMFIFMLPAMRLLAHQVFKKSPRFWGISGDLALGHASKVERGVIDA